MTDTSPAVKWWSLRSWLDWRGERKVKKWLVSPEGRRYMTEQGGGGAGEDGSLGMSVAGMIGKLMDEADADANADAEKQP